MSNEGGQKVADVSIFGPGISGSSRPRRGLIGLGALLVTAWLVHAAHAQSQSKEVSEHVKRATVEVIMAMSQQQKGDTKLGSGSGFFVNRTGLCITNNHVVDPTHMMHRYQKQREMYSKYNRLVYTVVVNGGTEDEKEYEAFVLYQNDLADQAIMQVRDESGGFLETPNYLKFLPGHRLPLAQKVWCYGFPGGDSRKEKQGKHPQVAITEGHIVDLPRRPDGDLKMIVTDALVDPGNSGGPLVDIHGHLVGTATLKPPAEVAGRANQSALVPADLTRQMITNAFQRGKLESGIDLEPFYRHLVGRDGFVDVPGYPRQASSDCVFLEDGNRICGAPVGETLTLPTPLGELTLPCAQMAYLLEQDDEHGIVLMDGGQRLPFNRDEAVLKFKPTGAGPMEQDLSEVRAVAFRKNGAPPDPPRGKRLLIGGDNYHLLLTEVSGDVKFASDLGVEMARPLDSIRTVETNEVDDQVVGFADGSRVVGAFEDHAIRAVLALSGSPQTISLAEVRAADIDVIENNGGGSRGLTLADLFENASLDLREVAALLEAGDWRAADAKLASRLSPEYFRKQGTLKQDQLRLLDASSKWLRGDFAEAARGFRKVKSSNDEGLKWFAQARLALLDRFPDGTFDGQPLKDPKVLSAASAAVARDILHQAKEILREQKAAPPENRGLFQRLKRQLESQSDDLMIASQLGSKVANVARVWLLSWQVDVMYNELNRLADEIKAKQEQLESIQGAARDHKGRQLEQDIRGLEKYSEATEGLLRELNGRLAELGFIINDPDMELLE